MLNNSLSHNYHDLIHLFEQNFYASFNTRLIKGGDEPLYSPANEECTYHQIIFAHGYYASALHEISHWCMAGDARRQLEDFGYWYMPDGRNAEQQKIFEQVEIKPQAIEWAFCVAADKKFNVSADNLNGAAPDTVAFKENVYQQVQQYLIGGFPVRAQQFINTLANFYQVPLPLTSQHFSKYSVVANKESIVHV
jgi:elongation factor P hydroxylase